MYTNGYNIYKNNSVNYASKEQLLLMLVDGAVRFAKMADTAMKENNIQETHTNIVKTENIFIELMSTLDRKAGDWAEQLFKVYRFIYDKLVEANLKKDINILHEVMPLIEQVRDLWHETYEASKKQTI